MGKKEMDESIEKNSKDIVMSIIKILIERIIAALVIIFVSRIIVSVSPNIIDYIIIFIGCVLVFIISLNMIKDIKNLCSNYREVNTKAEKTWKERSTISKGLYIFNCLLGWGVVITIGVCIFSEVTRDNLIAILKGEPTYEEVVLESETKYGYTFDESLKSLLGDYNINTFYMNEKVPVVEVKGKCTVMGKMSDIGLQFVPESRTIGDFNTHTATINGKAVGKLVVDSLIEAICESPTKNNGSQGDLRTYDMENYITKKPTEEDEKQSYNKDIDNDIILDETMYGEWVNENGTIVNIDKNYIFDNTYTVLRKEDNIYLIEVNDTEKYTIGLQPSEEGIVIHSYDDETKSFYGGELYYNTGI